VSTDDLAPKAPSGSRDLAGLWIKRGDVHATEAADVVRAESTSGALAILADFRRRGVAQALLQEHVAGDLIKFYGVGAAGAFYGVNADGGPEGGGGWFEWFYHRDQVLARHPFDAAVLEAAARNAAAALRLEVWGGDAIVGPDGAPVVIDLNAWPSFALYRDRAADAIAERLAARFESAGSRRRTGVTQ
jgi:GNAT superfamily N-acetyltransferase